MTLFKSRPSYLNVVRHGGAIPELDGLRGIAILLVLARHSVRPIYEIDQTLLPIGSWDLATPLLNGWIGVDLFFVLSGFLIAHHLLRHWPARLSSGFLFRYWSKRIFRTFPAYFAVLFFICFVGFPYYTLQTQDFARELTWHIFFMQDYFGSHFMPAFWSLGVEEKFYLLCPFVLLLVLRTKKESARFRSLALLALLPLFMRLVTLADAEPRIHSYATYFWTVRSPAHLALDGLWLGVICALLLHSRPQVLATRPRSRNTLLFAGLVPVSVLLLVAPLMEMNWWAVTVALFGIALGFAAIVMAVVSGKTVATRLLSSVILRFFSNISYSLYLTHMLCIPAAMHLTESIRSEVSALVSFAVFLPVFLALSIGTALILHLLVEKPFLILKSRIKMRRPAAAQPISPAAMPGISP